MAITRGTYSYRKFDGEVFQWNGTAYNEAGAKSLAERSRKMGRKCRAVKVKNGWAVYFRHGRKRRNF